MGHDEVTPENSLVKGERVETAERSIEEGGGGGRNDIDPLASINVRRALRDEDTNAHDVTKEPSSSHSAGLLGLRPPGKRSAAEHRAPASLSVKAPSRRHAHAAASWPRGAWRSEACAAAACQLWHDDHSLGVNSLNMIENSAESV